uniref:Sex-determining region Y protein n=1 Tax=Caenorhabditis tropicalis TaxID=1561998 RepID=A0A1I7UF78_9PELO
MISTETSTSENPPSEDQTENGKDESKMLLNNILKASATISPFLLNGSFNYDLILKNPIFHATNLAASLSTPSTPSNISVEIPSDGFNFPMTFGTNFGVDNGQLLQNSSDSSGQSSPKSVKSPSPKRPKSPNHIKRPMNAFMIWAKEERKKIVEEEKKHGMMLHNSSISKMLGARWNALSEEEKQPFKEEQIKHKAAHYEKYPDYIFKPRRRKSRVSVDSGEKCLKDFINEVSTDTSTPETDILPQLVLLKNLVEQAFQPVE